MIEQLDHFVLTVCDFNATLSFYTEVLGMEEITFGEGWKALRFGNQKINLHEAGREIVPHAHRPTPSSADLCLITFESLPVVIEHLESVEVNLIDGPIPRTGATDPLQSVYSSPSTSVTLTGIWWRSLSMPRRRATRPHRSRRRRR